MHKRKRHCVDCGTYIDSVLREIVNALEATRSASSNRDDELADRITKNMTSTKQQIDRNCVINRICFVPGAAHACQWWPSTAFCEQSIQ